MKTKLLKLRREILVGLSKMGLSSATIKRGSLRFKIPLVEGMGRFLFVTHEPWRRKMLTVISKMNPQTILDVGVNVGQTLLEIKEIMPKVTYYGFEPNPACVFYVNELIRLNQLPDSYILPFGLSSKEGTSHLHSNRWDDAGSSFKHDENATYSTLVYTQRGDHIVENEEIGEISLIKIDTEGFELEVLKGLAQTIEQHQPVIFCEVFKDGDQNQELFDWVKKKDYLVFERGPDFTLVCMNDEAVFSNPCHDYIFAPRKKSEALENEFNNV